jgi:hypothetical protein
MTTLPKPKHCGQSWLEMTATDKGRICGQCSKVIIDFSKMSWFDIEMIQQQNNNSVCGMYSARQLGYWGKELPTSNCSKIVATTAMLVSLTASTLTIGQVIIPKDNVSKTIISGTVTGKSEQGFIDTLGFTVITLKSTKIGVMADERGHYQLDITDYIDTLSSPTVIYSMVGYHNLELKLNRKTQGEIKFDAQLEQGEVIYFSVSKPTFGQQIKWKFQKWFGRKDK